MEGDAPWRSNERAHWPDRCAPADHEGSDHESGGGATPPSQGSGTHEPSGSAGRVPGMGSNPSPPPQIDWGPDHGLPHYSKAGR